MLIEYIRNAKRQPIGCIVAIDKDSIGISLVHPKDEFNKKLAKKIAIGRAELGIFPEIPAKKEQLVERYIQRIVDKADRHFSRETVG